MRTGMKLIVVFRSSANAPKKVASYSRLAVCVYGCMLLNQLTDLY